MKQPIPEHQWRVPRVWQVSFELACAPGHTASFYGFKSEEAAKPAIAYLENNADVTKLWVKVHWKKTKMSKWEREERIIR